MIRHDHSTIFNVGDGDVTCRSSSLSKETALSLSHYRIVGLLQKALYAFDRIVFDRETPCSFSALQLQSNVDSVVINCV